MPLVRINMKRSSNIEEALPQEILEYILSFCDRATVFTARLTSNTLARAGSRFILDEVMLVYERDRFKELYQIAQHPVATSVRSLFYQPDRFVHGAVLANDHEDEEQTEERKRWHEKDAQLVQDFMDQQSDIAQEMLDVHCIKELLDSCTRLDSITIALPGKYWYRPVVFGKTRVAPYGDERDAEGVDQFKALVAAVTGAKRKLQSLTIWELNHKIFEHCQKNANLRLMLRTLTRLRVCVCPTMFNAPSNARDTCMDSIENGDLNSFLSAAKKLQELKLMLQPFHKRPTMHHVFGT